MDKERTTAAYRAAGLPVVESRLVPAEEVRARHVMPPPYVVKPNNEGSSVGIHIVRDAADAPPQLDATAPALVMVEAFAPGRELTTSVMGDRALGVTDILTDGWYDYHAKYARPARPCEPRLPRRLAHRFPLGRGEGARRADSAGDEHAAGDDPHLAHPRTGRACGDRVRPALPLARGGCLMRPLDRSLPFPRPVLRALDRPVPRFGRLGWALVAVAGLSAGGWWLAAHPERAEAAGKAFGEMRRAFGAAPATDPRPAQRPPSAASCTPGSGDPRCVR